MISLEFNSFVMSYKSEKSSSADEELLIILDQTLPWDKYVQALEVGEQHTKRVVVGVLTDIFTRQSSIMAKINAVRLLELLLTNAELECIAAVTIDGQVIKHFENVAMGCWKYGYQKATPQEAALNRLLQKVYYRMVIDLISELAQLWPQGDQWKELEGRMIQKQVPVSKVRRGIHQENLKNKTANDKDQANQDNFMGLPSNLQLGSIVRKEKSSEDNKQGSQRIQIPPLDLALDLPMDLPDGSILRSPVSRFPELDLCPASIVRQNSKNGVRQLADRGKIESFKSFIETAAQDKESLQFLESNISKLVRKNQPEMSGFSFADKAQGPLMSQIPNKKLETQVETLIEKMSNLESLFRMETNDLRTAERKLQIEVSELREELTRVREQVAHANHQNGGQEESRKVIEISEEVGYLKDQLKKLKTQNTKSRQRFETDPPYSPKDYPSMEKSSQNKELLHTSSILNRLLNPQNSRLRIQTSESEITPIRKTTHLSIYQHSDIQNQGSFEFRQTENNFRKNKTMIEKQKELSGQWGSPHNKTIKNDSFDIKSTYPASLLYRKACLGLSEIFCQSDPVVLSLKIGQVETGSTKFYLIFSNKSSRVVNFHISLKNSGIFQIQPNFSEKTTIGPSNSGNFAFLVKGFDLERFSAEVPQIVYSVNGNSQKTQLPISILSFCSLKNMDVLMSESFLRKSQLKTNFIRTSDHAESLWRSFLTSKGIRHYLSTPYSCLVCLTNSTKCCLQLQFDDQSRQCKFSHTVPTSADRRSSEQLSRLIFRTLRLLLGEQMIE